MIKKNRMEIVLNALRMLDDGVIEKVGPTTADELLSKKGSKSGDGQKRELPVIKGPAIDYLYILDEEEFPDGRTVVKEGSHGKWIWVILDGAAQITRETSRGPLTIAKLGEGCFIGSFTSLLFQEYARSATVTAMGDLRLGLLDTQRLAGEFYTLPADFRNTLSSLDRRLREDYRQSRGSLHEEERILFRFLPKDSKSWWIWAPRRTTSTASRKAKPMSWARRPRAFSLC